jgi:acylphosphatase
VAKTETRRIRVVVTGRVQGVYFRASTREKAQRLGLVGWVRNRADGSVELEAQGPEEAVAALVSWCHTGPSAAHVANLVERPVDIESGESSFSIRH